MHSTRFNRSIDDGVVKSFSWKNPWNPAENPTESQTEILWYEIFGRFAKPPKILSSSKWTFFGVFKTKGDLFRRELTEDWRSGYTGLRFLKQAARNAHCKFVYRAAYWPSAKICIEKFSLKSSMRPIRNLRCRQKAGTPGLIESSGQ